MAPEWNERQTEGRPVSVSPKELQSAPPPWMLPHGFQHGHCGLLAGDTTVSNRPSTGSSGSPARRQTASLHSSPADSAGQSCISSYTCRFCIKSVSPVSTLIALFNNFQYKNSQLTYTERYKISPHYPKWKQSFLLNNGLLDHVKAMYKGYKVKQPGTFEGNNSERLIQKNAWRKGFWEELWEERH